MLIKNKKMKSPLFALLFSVVFLFSCTRSGDKNSVELSSLKELQELFADPPAGYRSAPLWVWNDDVTRQQIDEQMEDFKDKGIGGVFIHPRPGLVTPYLSEQWFDLVKHTVDKGKEIGMDVWLYDENSYPSGFAGGHVPAEMPDSYNEGAGLTSKKVDKLPDDAGEYFLVLKRVDSKFVDITQRLNEEKNRQGEFYLYKKQYFKKQPWNAGFSYVDLLHKGVTEKFIDVTMSGYEKAIGNEFGKEVKGIFTDEPHIGPPGGIKWTPDLFKEFKKRNGYDLKTNLPSIELEIGDWKHIRHDYYATLLGMFIDRWSKPYHSYTEKHHLKWTGHYWDHDWPDPDPGPDNMAMYAWHQQPAIDVLMNRYSEDVNAQFGNARIVKELRSVANQKGMRRTLSETYGAGGWDLRFQDMKRIGDWEYALGVNFLDQHLSYITLEGARKKDHPQSFSYHEPWWKFYRYQGDYFGRLSVALSLGEQINDILVIEPTTTAWMYFSKSMGSQKYSTLGPAFQDLVLHFEKNQVEYDLASENILDRIGGVENEKLVVGKRAYSIVVIPPALENLERGTLELLKKFLGNGGLVVSYNSIPSFVDGRESDELNDFVNNNDVNWLNVRFKKDDAVRDELSSMDIRFTNPENAGGKLFHHRRQFADGQIVFLVNTSDEEWSKGEFTIKGGSVKELDPQSGKVLPYPGKVKGDSISVKFELPPVGSLLLMFDDQKQENPSGGKTKVKILSPATPVTVRAEKPNMLTLDYCGLLLDGKTYKDIYYFKAADKIFRHYGFDGNPWSSAVQYKSAILDRDTFSVGTGFEVSYPFTVDVVPDGPVKVVVERPNLWSVSINGKEVEAMPDEYWLDRKFAVYNIGSFIKRGENKIKLTAPKMSVFAEVEPVYILGNFKLRSQAKGWGITPAGKLNIGSWKDQGYPFYADAVSYTKKYRLQEAGKGRHYVVKLTDWNGSVAEVKVNGEHAGIVDRPPYELDITKSVSQGENEVKVSVYGTLRNLLGPHHIGHVIGSAWPASFEKAPKKTPPGYKYDQLDYGLFQDFLLLEATGASKKVYMKMKRAEAPRFSTKDTIRSKPFTVSLLVNEPGTEVRYTTDGTVPNRRSKLYKKPISIQKSTIIRARAYNPGRLPGRTVQRKFYIVKKKKSYDTSNLKRGIRYSYYEGNWGDVPEFEFLKKEKSGVAGKLNLNMGRRSSNFALLFDGFLKIDEPGDYKFYLTSNDGSKLYIDDILVVDNGGSHGAEEKSGKINLSKGYHALQLEYFDGGGSQALNVAIESAGMEMQEIPGDMLFYQEK